MLRGGHKPIAGGSDGDLTRSLLRVSKYCSQVTSLVKAFSLESLTGKESDCKLIQVIGRIHFPLDVEMHGLFLQSQ